MGHMPQAGEADPELLYVAEMRRIGRLVDEHQLWGRVGMSANPAEMAFFVGYLLGL